MPITKYEGQTFEHMSFVMEESFFVNCVLKECDLFYSGGDVDWVNVKFDNSRWHFRGAALKTTQLLQLLGILKQPEVVPQAPATSTMMN